MEEHILVVKEVGVGAALVNEGIHRRHLGDPVGLKTVYKFGVCKVFAQKYTEVNVWQIGSRTRVLTFFLKYSSFTEYSMKIFK